jgi:F0F1-type ATP synthase assembly protein I
MANDERVPPDGLDPAVARNIARKRDELLAQAREGVAQANANASGKSLDDKGLDASSSKLMGLGLQFVIAILLFLYAGMWLDKQFGTAPWLLLAGAFIGAAAGFYSLWRAMAEENKKYDSAKKDPR